MALTKVRNILDVTADTMADLLTMKHKKGSVQLLGFHERGDGGGGVFYWDADESTASHNGGTIIAGNKNVSEATWGVGGAGTWFDAPAVTTGCWKREFSGAVDVKWFGAKGDGVTDDSYPLHYSSSILESNDSLYVGHGEYLVDLDGKSFTKVFDFVSKDNITVFGNGGLNLVGATAETIAVFSLISLYDCSNFSIKGLTLKLTDGVAGKAGLVGLSSYSVDYPTFTAIRIQGGSNNSVSSCVIESFNRNGATLDSGTTYKFKQMPVFVTGTTIPCDGFVFTDNTFKNTNTYKIFTHKVSRCSILNNKFENIVGRYPTIRHLALGVEDVVISNNLFSGGISANNDPLNSTMNTDLPCHIQLDSSVAYGGGAVVSNNVFGMTGSGGILVTGYRHAIIDSNLFYEQENMSSVSGFDIVNFTKSCVWIAPNGAVDPVNIKVTGNIAKGVLNRIFCTQQTGVNCACSYNIVDSAKPYGIYAMSPRNMEIVGNNIADVVSLVGVVNTPVGILTTLNELSATEQCMIHRNNLHNFLGTGLQVNSYTPSKCDIRNNLFKEVTLGTNVPQQDGYQGVSTVINGDNFRKNIVLPRISLDADATYYKIAELTGDFSLSLKVTFTAVGITAVSSAVITLTGRIDSPSNTISQALTSFSASTVTAREVAVIDEGGTKYLALKSSNTFILNLEDSVLSGVGFIETSVEKAVTPTVLYNSSLTEGNISNTFNLLDNVNSRFNFYFTNNKGVSVLSSGIVPYLDNNTNLGSAANRFSTIYAATGAINTSDARLKTFLDISTAEKEAALEIKANLCKFKFNEAISSKGDESARVHFGVSAQHIGEILAKHGLNPDSYAFYCYDEWEEEVGDDEVVTKEAGNRYGIRYEELLSFIISAM